MGITYKQAGVNIEKGEDFVSLVKNLFPEKKKEKVTAFSSLFSLTKILKKYKDPFLVGSSDGVGTKLLIAQTLGVHNTVGIDLVAMNVNDIIALGARPLFFLDYIACGKLDLKVMSGVMQGLKKGLRQAECELLGGETAEMPDLYSADEYDLAGFCTGIVDKKKVINGSNIKSGNVVLGISSSGIHSNGYSLVRKALSKKEISIYGKDLLRPTRIYVKPVMELLSSFARPKQAVRGIAHVTGGAFYTKAVKILPDGMAMALNKKAWPVPGIFKLIREKGKIEDKEMYSVFNMGIGMIVVMAPAQADKALNILNRYYKTYVIGKIVKAEKRLIWT